MPLTPEVMKALADPFDPDVLEFKPGAIARDKTRALAMPFVDAREYEDRLDAVVPGEWQCSFSAQLNAATVEVVEWDETSKQRVPRERKLGKVSVICSLRVGDAWRESCGEADLSDANAVTSAEAQAFKRACSKFGLGRYLYNVGQIWADYDEQRRGFTPEAIAAMKESMRTTGKLGEVASAPRAPSGDGKVTSPENLGEIALKFGKWNGKTLNELTELDPGYLTWFTTDEKAKESVMGKTIAQFLATKQVQPAQPQQPPLPTEPTSAPAPAAPQQPPAQKPPPIAGNTIIGTLPPETQAKYYSRLKQWIDAAKWDEARVVGHVAKHCGLDVKPGVTTQQGAVAKMTSDQAKVLKETLQTVCDLYTSFQFGNITPEQVSDWCNKNMDKKWTDRKTLQKMVDELTREERLKLLIQVRAWNAYPVQPEDDDLAAEFA